MNRTVFGAAEGEQKVSFFTLKNRNGMEITMSDLGSCADQSYRAEWESIRAT